MIEIRFHGRGGQGIVVASEILAAAFFAEGKNIQAFPAFGVERRGAPVSAFLRVDDRPVRLRCQIQAPDHVVVLDPTLLSAIDVTEGLKPQGWVLMNSNHPPQHFRSLSAGGWKVATVDASSIAQKHRLGNRTNPIVNTAILGAFSGVTRLVSIDAVLKAIMEGAPVRPTENVAAAREAAGRFQIIAWEEVES
jgi:2-oxoacid:acceptor oxidoreductase gamma subunit (pyruvate/2-ketoisovalerate family)